MTTVKQLVELLSKYPQDFEVIDEQNRPFVHIINTDDNRLRISAEKPIGICNRSGGYVYPSIVKGYVGFSPELDEDLYEIEFTRDMSEMREQTMKTVNDLNQEELEELRSRWYSQHGDDDSLEDVLEKTDKEIIKIYLDWVNNFISLDKFADHYGLNEMDANYVIDLGRKLNNNQAIQDSIDVDSWGK